MKYYVYDIEVYPNYFLAIFRGEDTHAFELGFGVNQLQELREFLSEKKLLIGFNILHYDNIILSHIVEHHADNQSIKRHSDAIIRDDKDYYRPKAPKWKSIDLAMHWTEKIRIQSKISLKYLGFRLRHPVIQELPFHPDRILSEAEAKEVKSYCFNDIEITESLFEHFKPDLKLREVAKNLFGVNAINMNDAKLGLEILLKMADIKSKEPNNLYPVNVLMRDFMPVFEFSNKAPITRNLYEEMCNCVFTTERVFDKTIIFTNPDGSKIKTTYGEGGIHGIVNKSVIKPNPGQVFEDQDADSLYPVLATRWKFFAPHLTGLPDAMDKIIEYRIQKKKQKGLRESTIYKLALNAAVGNLKQPYSWLYYPIGNLTTCFTGQLCITYLTELYINNGINVIQQNTDGVSIIYDKEKEATVKKILVHVSEMFKLTFQSVYFEQMWASHVNGYLAKYTDGSLKKKGFFETENKPLEKGDNYPVIAKAVVEHLVNNVPVDDYLKSNTDIYDYCGCPRIDKKYTVTWMGQEQQKINRLYVSENGAYLYKKKPTDKEPHFVNSLSGWGVTLFNTYVEKPFKEYRVNYRFYKAKIYDVLNEIFDNQQTSLL